MRVIINGKEEYIDKERLTVSELLKEKKVEMPETVSVQLNSSFVRRNDFNSTFIKENDKVDFLYFMGGGG
ncbi:MAG: thiamine biosynthesis protein ThiS [Spirochaetes bacterium]|nr:MAG: thiamine biosynthesis protein ThiS [Spirochaetota bacterium]